MSILGTIFSGGAKELVEGVGGVIDSLHTSKEEKLAAEQKIKELVANYEVQMEKEISSRWEADMKRTIKANEKAKDILRRLLEILLRHRQHMDARREVLREIFVNFTEENTRLLWNEKDACERMVDNLRHEMTLLQKKALLEWG